MLNFSFTVAAGAFHTKNRPITIQKDTMLRTLPFLLLLISAVSPLLADPVSEPVPRNAGSSSTSDQTKGVDVPPLEDVTTENSHVTIDRAYLAASLENVSRLLAEGRAVPYLKNGTVIGFRYFAIKDGGFYDRIGLHNGDIIPHIQNNPKAGTPDTLITCFKELLEGNACTIKLIRNRQERIFRYRFSNRPPDSEENSRSHTQSVPYSIPEVRSGSAHFKEIMYVTDTNGKTNNITSETRPVLTATLFVTDIRDPIVGINLDPAFITLTDDTGKNLLPETGTGVLPFRSGTGDTWKKGSYRSDEFDEKYVHLYPLQLSVEALPDKAAKSVHLDGMLEIDFALNTAERQFLSKDIEFITPEKMRKGLKKTGRRRPLPAESTGSLENNRLDVSLAVVRPLKDSSKFPFWFPAIVTFNCSDIRLDRWIPHVHSRFYDQTGEQVRSTFGKLDGYYTENNQCYQRWYFYLENADSVHSANVIIPLSAERSRKIRIPFNAEFPLRWQIETINHDLVEFTP